jgi:hypothetical protein
MLQPYVGFKVARNPSSHAATESGWEHPSPSPPPRCRQRASPGEARAASTAAAPLHPRAMVVAWASATGDCAPLGVGRVGMEMVCPWHALGGGCFPERLQQRAALVGRWRSTAMRVGTGATWCSTGNGATPTPISEI